MFGSVFLGYKAIFVSSFLKLCVRDNIMQSCIVTLLRVLVEYKKLVSTHFQSMPHMRLESQSIDELAPLTDYNRPFSIIS
jgi:hypothetical protein